MTWRQILITPERPVGVQSRCRDFRAPAAFFPEGLRRTRTRRPRADSRGRVRVRRAAFAQRRVREDPRDPAPAAGTARRTAPASSGLSRRPGFKGCRGRRGLSRPVFRPVGSARPAGPGGAAVTPTALTCGFAGPAEKFGKLRERR
ncbi:hypothetical protein Slala04_24040 [Streptomyces lavendulae subsp. lavendulae]|nr:hypothetical protein Slala04_24040 [Streptomyces lavendulae subsp. lavendulae]